MKRILIILLVLAVAAGTYAQYRDESTPPSIKSRFTDPQSGLFNIFDNPNLDMSHSFSMAFSSSSRGSVLQQMYMNSIRYRLSNPLSLNLRLGYLQQPYSSYEGGFTNDNGAFMGSANLMYRPAKNVFISFGISNIPYYYYPTGLDGYDWYFSPFRSTSQPYAPQPGVFSPGFDDR